jgi:hypothetical protein
MDRFAADTLTDEAIPGIGLSSFSRLSAHVDIDDIDACGLEASLVV